MNKKYFTVITAPDREKFLTLHTYDLDLIVPTAKREKKNPTIEALLTQQEIDQLLKGGFSVEIKEEGVKRARAGAVTDSFEEWIQEITKKER